MFLKLKNQTHIDATKIISITQEGEKYSLKMNNNSLVDITAGEFLWLVKICGFMVQAKNKAIFNLNAISSIVPHQDGALVILDNGDTFQISDEEILNLAAECKCLDLEQKILSLQNNNIQPNDYKKI
jgi:hypothetical protein